MQHRVQDTNKRFAWLTPLQGETTSKGPWILSENETHRFILQEQNGPTHKLSIGSLLKLTSTAIAFAPTPSDSDSTDFLQSDCQRFRLISIKQKNDSKKLFVQNRNDFYTRLELYIDEILVLAFQEPVWPHLQHKTTTPIHAVELPTACLNWLESSVQSTNGLFIDSEIEFTVVENQAA